MIKYSEIQGLPADHPKVKEFQQELDAMSACYALAQINNSLGLEGSLDHFNRFQAGDR